MGKLVCTGLGATLLLFSTYIPTALAQLYVLGGDAEATPSSTPSADVLALISTAQLCSCTAHFYDGWAPGHCSGDPSCDPAPTTTLTTTNDFTSTPTYSPVAGGTSSISWGAQDAASGCRVRCLVAWGTDSPSSLLNSPE